MDRRHLWLLTIAAVLVVALHLVFRVRVMVAGGKFFLALALVIALTCVLWPARRG